MGIGKTAEFQRDGQNTFRVRSHDPKIPVHKLLLSNKSWPSFKKIGLSVNQNE